jgi:hypothetical protein
VKNFLKKETIKNTKICRENGEEFFNEWFSYKPKTFISHIDTLYFTVFVDCTDWNEDERKLQLIEVLRKNKEAAERDRVAKPIFIDDFDGLETQPFMGFMFYKYHLGIKDKFDIFVAETQINKNTPAVFIQLRSQSLWLDGVRGSFDTACDCVDKILSKFGLSIMKVQEKRIDSACHTNYIKDLINFVPENNLKDMQVSNFARWHKEGQFFGDVVFCDYVTLGRRKSNNVFFRVYDKCQEVIEMGYKQFFIPIWFDNGLISKFDEFLLRRAFVYGSYVSKDKARCEFYAQYGQDVGLKLEIMDAVNSPDAPVEWFTKTAKGLVPDLTTVCNVEFQTKRKFYERLQIPVVVDCLTYKQRIYNLFTQMSELVRFITNDTIRFIKYKGVYENIPRKNCPYADWWSRLRSTKFIEFNDEFLVDYYREEQINLDTERQKRMTINKIASMSAYKKYNVVYEYDINTDVDDFLSELNDNDIQLYYAVLDKKSREIVRKRAKTKAT